MSSMHMGLGINACFRGQVINFFLKISFSGSNNFFWKRATKLLKQTEKQFPTCQISSITKLSKLYIGNYLSKVYQFIFFNFFSQLIYVLNNCSTNLPLQWKKLPYGCFKLVFSIREKKILKKIANRFLNYVLTFLLDIVSILSTLYLFFFIQFPPSGLAHGGAGGFQVWWNQHHSLQAGGPSE